MKRILFFSFCLFALPFTLKAQKNNFTITTDLSNWAPVYVILTKEADTLFSENTINGQIKYSGYIKKIAEGGMILKKGNLTVRLSLYFEPGNIFIKDVQKNLIEFPITGTRNNDSLWQLQEKKIRYNPSPNIPGYDSLEKEKQAFYKNFILRNKNLFACLTVFRTTILNSPLSTKDKQDIFNSLSRKVRRSYGGRQVSATLYGIAHSSIGKKCPHFSQKDQEGRKINLEDFRGKYLLVDFWASWCVPCREENPNLKYLYSTFRSYNFEIISISLDVDKTKWLAAIEKDSLSWVHTSDLKGWKNEIAQQFNIQSIPSNLLIDPKGIIIGKDMSAAVLRQTINNIFLRKN